MGWRKTKYSLKERTTEHRQPYEEHLSERSSNLEGYGNRQSSFQVPYLKVSILNLSNCGGYSENKYKNPPQSSIPDQYPTIFMYSCFHSCCVYKDNLSDIQAQIMMGELFYKNDGWKAEEW